MKRGNSIDKLRVYTFLDGEVIDELDQRSSSRRVSRSELMRIAIEQYITQKGDCDLTQLKEDLTLKDSEIVDLKQRLTSKDQEGEVLIKTKENLTLNITQLKEDLTLRDDEIDRLKQQLDKTLADATQRWEELKSFRKEIDKLKKELEDAGHSNQKLKDDLLKRQSETDQLAKTKEELAVVGMEAKNLKETITLRNQDIAFLQGHVAQLTQTIGQLSLKPGEEEIKAKHWYQFWK